MAFTWVQDISSGAGALAAGMNEVQTNLDSIYTALGIVRNGCGSGAGWTKFPLAGGLIDTKESAEAQELRDATDYAYENKCPSYCNDENSGFLDADKVGVDAANNPAYCNDENSGFLDADKAGVDAANNPGYCSDQHTGYQSGEQTGYDSGYDPGEDTGEDSGANPGDDGSVNSSYNSGYCGSLNDIA